MWQVLAHAHPPRHAIPLAPLEMVPYHTTPYLLGYPGVSVSIARNTFGICRSAPIVSLRMANVTHPTTGFGRRMQVFIAIV